MGGNEGTAPFMPHLLYPGKKTSVPYGEVAEWIQKSIDGCCEEKNPFSLLCTYIQHWLFFPILATL
jgi:hypothetical protein